MNTDSKANTPSPEDNQGKAPGFFQIIQSVLAASFGVQSSKNRERDFKHGKLRVFVVAGIIFTGLFLLTVFTIVQIVLS
jgi:hypothetical protein